ncbi:MAG: TonB family protein, partial [Fibrobacteria bacterium]|nr:TonB family protein [Fibrobacteria bacterium]
LSTGCLWLTNINPRLPGKRSGYNKKEYKAIKSVLRRAKPSSPVSRTVQLDLSVVSGGEGVAVEAGVIGVITYKTGETDTDARVIDEGKEPSTPLRARRENVSGEVIGLWVVNESGYAVEIEILKEAPPGYGFGKEVRKYLKSIRFKPATIKNVPVRQQIKQKIVFDIH